jgi:Uncharacterized conserved protein (DUF2285)
MALVGMTEVQAERPPSCENCGCATVKVGKPSRIGSHPLINVYKCQPCRQIISITRLHSFPTFASDLKMPVPESRKHPFCSRHVASKLMQTPPLDPDVADTAPSDSVLTVYDEEHVITYLRLLDADAESADWREVARVVLHLDPEQESDRARRAFESHLSRAKWMMEQGYRHLLRGSASA